MHSPAFKFISKSCAPAVPVGCCNWRKVWFKTSKYFNPIWIRWNKVASRIVNRKASIRYYAIASLQDAIQQFWTRTSVSPIATYSPILIDELLLWSNSYMQNRLEICSKLTNSNWSNACDNLFQREVLSRIEGRSIILLKFCGIFFLSAAYDIDVASSVRLLVTIQIMRINRSVDAEPSIDLSLTGRLRIHRHLEDQLREPRSGSRAGRQHWAMGSRGGVAFGKY